MRTDPIGQILLQTTRLTAAQLDAVLRLQSTRRPRCELGHLLIEQGHITPQELMRALATQWHIPFIETIKPEQIKPELVRNINLTYLKHYKLLPIYLSDMEQAVAMADPLAIDAYDNVMNLLGRVLPRVAAPAAEIEQAISRCFYNREATHQAADDEAATDTAGSSLQEDLLNINHQEPTVRLVNTILFQAVNRRASDIHIESYDKEVKVRFRTDGVLHDIFSPPMDQYAALISRLKIMANLNIAERRLPQDGQCRIRIGQRELDIRISIIPTAGGERAVLRLLDRQGQNLSLDKIGFSSDIKNRFSRLISAPHGIILLTGPTGSGKTSTLYCAINLLNNHERNILTVEDPIEYQLPGIGQMQVKPKINLTFANCLRHILRQDPDVIMIGEIRDRETAEIATHASLTGHLVLSTLHTNDSVSAVTRMVDIGIEPYLIASSLIGVMAQRLVRTICPHCKTACKTEYNLALLLEENTLSDSQALRDQKNNSPFFNKQFYTGSGCEQCMQTGYHGRTGIFELLVIDDDLKSLVNQNADAQRIKELALRKGMRTLRGDGLRQALAGVTTVEEVLRVTQAKLIASDLDMTATVEEGV